MKRAGRHLLSSMMLLGLAGATAQGVASCADSTAPSDAVLDAGPQPDSATIVEKPDAPVTPPCTGGAWCAVAIPTTAQVSLNGVWGSSRDDVWIVGSPDTTLHWDGARLLSANANTRQTQFGIWGSGKSDVWSFSTGNAMWHSTGFEDGGDGGAGWSLYDGADGGGWPGSISAMWGRSADDVWAVGPFAVGTPTIWHCDGWRNGAPAWQFVNTVAATDTEPAHAEPLSFNAIWGNANFEVWIVGMGGKTRYGSAVDKAPGTWTAVNSATSTDLNAVWGSPGGDVWAAGSGGVMRRFTRAASGGTWIASEVSLPTTATISGLYGFAADDIWAVGAAGTLLHWDGKTWTLAVVPGDAAAADDLFAVWGSGPTDVWAVGRNTLLHRGDAPLPRKSP